jgi:hypothetical protein
MELTCECGQVVAVEPQMLGRRGRCPACGRSLVLGADGQAAPRPAVPAAAAPVRTMAAGGPAGQAGFLRLVGVLGAVTTWLTTAFFCTWGYAEFGRYLWSRMRYGGPSFQISDVVLIAAITLGLGLGFCIGLLVLAISRTLSTAAADCRRTAEQIERLL